MLLHGVRDATHDRAAVEALPGRLRDALAHPTRGLHARHERVPEALPLRHLVGHVPAGGPEATTDRRTTEHVAEHVGLTVLVSLSSGREAPESARACAHECPHSESPARGRVGLPERRPERLQTSLDARAEVGRDRDLLELVGVLAGQVTAPRVRHRDLLGRGRSDLVQHLVRVVGVLPVRERRETDSTHAGPERSTGDERLHALSLELGPECLVAHLESPRGRTGTGTEKMRPGFGPERGRAGARTAVQLVEQVSPASREELGEATEALVLPEPRGLLEDLRTEVLGRVGPDSPSETAQSSAGGALELLGDRRDGLLGARDHPGHEGGRVSDLVEREAERPLPRAQDVVERALGLLGQSRTDLHPVVGTGAHGLFVVRRARARSSCALSGCLGRRRRDLRLKELKIEQALLETDLVAGPPELVGRRLVHLRLRACDFVLDVLLLERHGLLEERRVLVLLEPLLPVAAPQSVTELDLSGGELLQLLVRELLEVVDESPLLLLGRRRTKCDFEECVEHGVTQRGRRGSCRCP